MNKEVSLDKKETQLLKLLVTQLTKETDDETPENLLTILKAAYENKVAFSPGDIIEWKHMMKNRKRPEYNAPVIVMEILEKPIINTEGDLGSSGFNEICDIKIGLVIDNVFMMFYVDSHRFQKYKG